MPYCFILSHIRLSLEKNYLVPVQRAAEFPLQKRLFDVVRFSYIYFTTFSSKFKGFFEFFQ